LTLYQPDFDPDAEYCDQVPRAGKTIAVIDVSPGELRETPLTVWIIGQDASGDQRLVLALPPKIYRRGMADATVTLDAGSVYIARIKFGDGDREGLELSFPIRVNPWYRAIIVPGLILLVLIALTAISIVRYFVSSRREEALLEPVRSEMPGLRLVPRNRQVSQ